MEKYVIGKEIDEISGVVSSDMGHPVSVARALKRGNDRIMRRLLKKRTRRFLTLTRSIGPVRLARYMMSVGDEDMISERVEFPRPRKVRAYTLRRSLEISR